VEFPCEADLVELLDTRARKDVTISQSVHRNYRNLTRVSKSLFRDSHQ
jgi:hypothetical protein